MGMGSMGRLVLAGICGSALEGALLGILRAKAPDPPLDAYDIGMLLSQMPGILAAGGIASILKIPMTGANLGMLTFLCQAPFLSALMLLVLPSSGENGGEEKAEGEPR